MKNLNDYVAVYQAQLQKGDILIAYKELVSFVMKLRTDLKRNPSFDYSVTGILHGYLDYTYFYFSNDFLKSKKLKFGLVLNHLEMRFELWLLGNTAEIQKKYWTFLKETKWNKNRVEMPKYSVLEVVLIETPNFDDLSLLQKSLEIELNKNLLEISTFLYKNTNF